MILSPWFRQSIAARAAQVGQSRNVAVNHR
jgi:hypothetical protein